MTNRQILYNATIVNEGESFGGYLVIDGEMIAEVGKGSPSSALLSSCHKTFDLKGYMIIPGVIDDQVHFRDPGLTHKADISTESRAAVAGGVTSFMDMPNTVPQTTTIEALNDKYAHAAETSLANYSFYIGATNDNIDTLKKVDFAHTCGVKAFLGSSTGNMLVDNSSALERIFSEVPAIIAVHSEDEHIINANRNAFISKYGDDLPLKYHPLIRSAEACYECTARTIELAEQCGSRLHVLHLSTARELPLFSNAPLENKRITAEVCVHHLWFCDEDYSNYGNRIKCNPAIKTIDDRNALRKGLQEGLIDVIATDHAPHLLGEKRGNCLKAASGAPLVQFSLIAMLELAYQGTFSIEQVVNKMCHAPARLYRIDRRGFLRHGYYADIAVVKCDSPHIVTDAQVVSRCAWTPFNGTLFHNTVAMTFVNGTLVYDNDTFNETFRGSRLDFLI